MNALPNYTLDTLSEAYTQAELKPKQKEEEYFLLNDKHPIWRFLFPLIMLIVGFIVCWVGGYE
jgi:hypothetical protein